MRRICAVAIGLIGLIGLVSAVPADAGAPSPVTYVPDVDLRFRSGTLTIIGSNDANMVEVCPVEGEVIVSVVSVDRFGANTEVAFTETFPVTRDVRVFLGRGDDKAVLQCRIAGEVAASFARDVVVNLGLDDDQLFGEDVTIPDDLTAIGGSGDDDLRLDRMDIVDDTIVRGNAGSDRFVAGNARFGDRLDVNLGSGEGLVNLFQNEIGRLSLRGGNDIDRFFLRGGLGSGPRVLGAGGDDTVELFESAFDGTILVNTGGGNDHYRYFGAADPELTYNILLGGGDDKASWTGTFPSATVATQVGDRINGGPGLDTRQRAAENSFGDGTFVGFEVDDIIDNP